MEDLMGICEQACKKAVTLGAGEAEIYAVSSKKIEISLENNDIHRTVSQQEQSIGIRTFINKSLGFASVNILTPDSIDSAVHNAISLSRKSPRDEYNGVPEPCEISKVTKVYDPASAGFGIEDGLKLAIRMLKTAKDFDKRVSVESGCFVADISKKVIINSKGVRAEELSNAFVYYIIGMAVDGPVVSTFDVQFDGTAMLSEIDVESVAREFAKNVVGSLGAGKGESFKGAIVLSPDAVMNFIHPVIFSANANNVQKGMSKLAGKLGQKVASELLTIKDDGLIEGGLATSAFDREGMPHKPVFIIKDGLLSSYLYNTYTAKKDKTGSSGHASGGPNSVPAIGTTNIIVSQGGKSKDEMIADIKNGVLVTSFSGFPNPVSGDFSGVVKGGYLIKNGQIVKPLVETLIAGNSFDLLSRISAVSKERKKVFTSLLPYIRVEDVSVTSG
ncbi:MAG: TldD/PmbA family protein [Planctomycetota bacterium]